MEPETFFTITGALTATLPREKKLAVREMPTAYGCAEAQAKMESGRPRRRPRISKRARARARET